MLDPPYDSKRARVSTPSAPRPQPDAGRQNGPAKAEADAGGLTGSDLQGSLLSLVGHPSVGILKSRACCND